MKKVIDLASNKGVKEVEVFYKELVNTEVSFENNNLKNISASQNSGIGIRGVIENRIGTCSYTHEKDTQNAIDKLIESSKFSEPKEFNFSNDNKFANPKIYTEDTKNISVEKLVSDGRKIIDLINQYEKNILTNIIFENEIETTKLVNSLGIEGEYKKSSFVAYLSGQIIEGTNFLDVDCFKYGISSDYDVDLLVNTLIEKVKLSRTNADFNSGKTKVLFTPRAFGDIMETVSQGVNGNAVEKGISPLGNRIGQSIFDERFTLVDDATINNMLGSKPFDDEGIPTRRTVVFENGVLKSHIHSLKTAARTKSFATGNGNRGSYATPPSPSFNNMIIVPGNESFESMLENMKDGIIIDEIMGLGMNNLLNGDFGGNIQLGFKVQNGKIVGRIKNAVFNSNIYKILKDDLVSLSDLNYVHPLVNSIFSNKKQPCALFKDINITIK